jgi:hypothetical protein
VSAGVALTHGFQVAFYVLVGLSLAAALIAAVFVESAPAPAVAEPAEREVVVLAEAA